MYAWCCPPAAQKMVHCSCPQASCFSTTELLCQLHGIKLLQQLTEPWLLLWLLHQGLAVLLPLLLLLRTLLLGLLLQAQPFLQ